MENITVACGVVYPWVSACASDWYNKGQKSCGTPGASYEVLERILGPLSNRIKVLPLGRLPVGEELAFVENGTADLSYDILSHQNLTLGLPFLDDFPAFIVKRRLEHAHDSHILFSLYDKSLWTIMSSIMVSLFIYKIFTKLSATDNKEKKLKQSYNLIVTSFCVALTIVLGVYTNFLAIGFSRQPTEKIYFKGKAQLAQLIYDNRCRFVVEQGEYNPASIHYQIVNPQPTKQQHTDPVAEKFRKAAHFNPPLIVKNINHMVKSIQTSNECLLGLIWDQTFPIIQARQCGLVRHNWPGKMRLSFSWIYRKGWQHADFVDKQLAGGSTDDFMEKVLKKLSRKYERKNCSDLTGLYDDMEPLNFRQLGDIFLVWFFGCLVAFCVHLFQVAHHFVLKASIPIFELSIISA